MITFDHVHKTYPGGVTAVSDLCLEVRPGETLVLLGTSGSGKTTTMKMVNRLIEPSQGRILLSGENIMDQDPIALRRGIGYAIQHIGLFPHMTVAENIRVVPRLLQWDEERMRERVDQLLTLVNLEPSDFRDRFPSQLSGGQKQRIGVARALAADPPIVLMDEPFGALDPITREQLQDEFLDLESAIQKTILFVTHDIFEAVKMGDRIALLDEGRLQQLATPAALVGSPANAFVGQFLGQHRFQLVLLTRTIRDMVEPSTEGDVFETSALPSGHLSTRTSLIGALDALKRARADRLPVYEKRCLRGEITRPRILRAITAALDAGGPAA